MFWFCSFPDPAIVKNLFADFRKFYYTIISYEFTSFSIFWPNQKISEKKYYKFQQHSLLTALPKQNLRMRTTYFLVLVFRHRWRVGLMKSKILTVKSFYNYPIYHLPAITEFSFFGHHNVRCDAIRSKQFLWWCHRISYSLAVIMAFRDEDNIFDQMYE